MKLDRTFVREVKVLCGDGSREAKFAMLKRIDAARRDLSTTTIRRTFNDCIRKHGRAVVCVCVAVTLDARKERLDRWGWRWAHEVLSILPCSVTPGNLQRAHIDDGIHPTAICDYAESLIRVTIEEE